MPSTLLTNLWRNVGTLSNACDTKTFVLYTHNAHAAIHCNTLQHAAVHGTSQSNACDTKTFVLCVCACHGWMTHGAHVLCSNLFDSKTHIVLTILIYFSICPSVPHSNVRHWRARALTLSFALSRFLSLPLALLCPSVSPSLPPLTMAL